jgi:hypothetical protein
VDAIDAESPRLGGALRHATLVSMTDADIALRLGAGIHASLLTSKKADVETALARHLGRAVRVAVEVGPADAAPEGSAPSLAAVEKAEREARSRKVRETARSHPNVREAARILGGEIDGTDEL